MTSVRPMRRSSEAAFSHSLVNRWTSVSSGVSSRAEASSGNAPPASTDWSCAQSPTSSTFAPRVGREAGEPVEGQGAGEGRLVDDDELALAELRPARGRARGATSRCCRTRRRGPRPAPARRRPTGRGRRRCPCRGPSSRPRAARAWRWSCPRRPGRSSRSTWRPDTAMRASVSTCSSLKQVSQHLRGRHASIDVEVDHRAQLRSSPRASSRSSAARICLGGEDDRVPWAGTGWCRRCAGRRPGCSASSGGVSEIEIRLASSTIIADHRLAVRRRWRSATPSSAVTPRPRGSSASRSSASR